METPPVTPEVRAFVAPTAVEVVPVRADVAVLTPALRADVAAPVVAVTGLLPRVSSLRGAFLLRWEGGKDSGAIVTFFTAAGLFVEVVPAEAGLAVVAVVKGFTAGAVVLEVVVLIGVIFGVTAGAAVFGMVVDAGTAFFVPMGVRGFTTLVDDPIAGVF